jgi:hypothetical protein
MRAAWMKIAGPGVLIRALVCLPLLGDVIWLGVTPLSLPSVGTAKDPKIFSPTGTIARIERPSPESFHDVTDRPLFIADRRLPKPAPPTPVLQPVIPAVALGNLDQIVLTGVLVAADHRSAMVARLQDAKVTILREGDMFQGWRVKHIEPGLVLFEGNGATKELQFPKPQRNEQKKNAG